MKLSSAAGTVQPVLQVYALAELLYEHPESASVTVDVNPAGMLPPSTAVSVKTIFVVAGET